MASLQHFDAILVDEGQDWLPDWWNTIRLFLSAGGEMLLMADQTQDLYFRRKSWTEQAMTGAGFPGGAWFPLEANHRIHPVMEPMLQDFVNRFLPDGESPHRAQVDLAFGSVRLYWVDAHRSRPGLLVSAILRKLPSMNDGLPIPYPDTTVLVDEHDDGISLLRDLDIPGADVGHVFHRDRVVQRALKVRFRKGMGRLKACTVHSFKGWEDRAIIVVVRRFDKAGSASLLYTAMSRVKRARDGACLVVLSYAPALSAFGQRWFHVLDENALVAPPEGGDLDDEFPF